MLVLQTERRLAMQPAILTPAIRAPRLSQLTRLERDAYVNRGGDLDMTFGYPDSLAPGWFGNYQVRPRDDFLRVPPSKFIDIIGGYFRALFGSEVFLAPTCSQAFGIAAAAVVRPGDEAIVIDRSFEPWPIMLETLGARVVYARRTVAGLPDVDSVAAACTARTRAIVLVSPDNPLGVICPADVLEQLAALCKDRDLTLIIDHCLAEVNPYRRSIPLLPRLPAAADLSWIAVGDTGKLLFGLTGPKFGALAYSDGWREPVAAAASPWFFAYDQYGLATVAVILSDFRFPDYRERLSAQIAANHEYLAAHVRLPLTVGELGAGCFALVDALGTGLDGESFARRLARERVLVSPVSWFPSGTAGDETRVRVALSRPPATIGSLVAALNAAAR
jgi:aspartate/methionine/tyrosine aminotransferase